MKEKVPYTITVKGDEGNFNMDVDSYGIRWAIEHAEKELRESFPNDYLFFEIVGVQKK